MKRILFTTLAFAAALALDEKPSLKEQLAKHKLQYSCFMAGCPGNMVCSPDGQCYSPHLFKADSEIVKGWVCTPGKCGPNLVCHDDGMCYPYMQVPVEGWICTPSKCGPGRECRDDGKCWLARTSTTVENNQNSPLKGVMCGSDINCDYNFVCRSGSCVYSPPVHTEQLLKCSQPSDCPEAHKCHLGLCRSPVGLSCKSDTQCGGSKVCMRGVCQNKTLEQTQ